MNFDVWFVERGGPGALITTIEGVSRDEVDALAEKLLKKTFAVPALWRVDNIEENLEEF